MFSLGEVLLTGAVALIVLGPERLPKAAYELARLVQRVNRLLQPVRKTLQEQTRQLEWQQNSQRAERVEKQSAGTTSHE